MLHRRLILPFALAGAFALSGMAHAQGYGAPEAGTPPTAAPGAPTTGMLTEQTLDVFVDAFVAVQEVREEFTERLHSANDEMEAQAMQHEAQQKMLEAVEATGMSVQEYNEVAMALQADPELLQRVQQKAQDRM